MGENGKLAGLGFGIGVLSGLLGIGGGIFMVPLLVAYFAFDQHLAHGTSLAVVIPTAIVGSVVYGIHGNVDMSMAANLVVGSMIGAGIGARMMKKLPALQLKRIFGVMLALVGVRMIFS